MNWAKPLTLSRERAVLVVSHPSGYSFQREITPLPFIIGRSPDCHLALRDSRISRTHARIFLENGEYFIEDAGSRHGLQVNGRRIQRQRLAPGDRIEFGIPDAYVLTFQPGGANLNSLLTRLAMTSPASEAAAGGLTRLRSFLEIARALESSFSIDDVLAAVVDAAVAVTRCERGALLLQEGGELRVRIARAASGISMDPEEIEIPRDRIQSALRGRRELLRVPLEPDLAALCLPLVKLRSGDSLETQALLFERETLGVLYLDSSRAADLSGANRELLESLALEASTILENARLLDEQREKQRLEEELRIARQIQHGLLPRSMPREGWLHAAGSSVPSSHVGGDYFDLFRSGDEAWSVILADVSGKGVSAALLAALLQGAFVLAGETELSPDRLLRQLNRFLFERTGGEKYATVFAGLITQAGDLHWVNAGHCAPLLLRASGNLNTLAPTAPPAGLFEDTAFPLSQTRLNHGDKLVIYSDGFPDTSNPSGALFGLRRFRELVLEHAEENCETLVARILEAVDAYAAGAEQGDDRTILVLEFHSPDEA